MTRTFSTATKAAFLAVTAVLTVAGLLLGGCGGQGSGSAFQKASREEQAKAFGGGKMPPDVAARIAEAQAKGRQAGATAAATAAQGGGTK